MIAPTPYSLHPVAPYGPMLGVFDAQRRIVACLPAITLNPEDTRDTGMLFAASPKMLAVLDEVADQLLWQIEKGGRESLRPVFGRVCDVIKEAKEGVK